MSRYEVIHNRRPGDVLLVTNSLDEACHFVNRHRVIIPWAWQAYLPSWQNKDRTAPPMLVPDVGTVETEWHYQSHPGELRNAHVLLKDGHPIMLDDDEIGTRAARWAEKLYAASRRRRRHGRRPRAHQYRTGVAYRHTKRLDDERDTETPRVRRGAVPPDPWDAHDGGHKASKSWKDQSTRRRQWKPVDMSGMPDADADTKDGKPEAGDDE